MQYVDYCFCCIKEFIFTVRQTCCRSVSCAQFIRCLGWGFQSDVNLASTSAMGPADHDAMHACDVCRLEQERLWRHPEFKTRGFGAGSKPLYWTGCRWGVEHPTTLMPWPADHRPSRTLPCSEWWGMLHAGVGPQRCVCRWTESVFSEVIHCLGD